ncbi:MAG: metallophosphoesterase, partial [Candidatus Omnitrophica bacterium]|nr:metallophosphoesterase [Candidatus Omnitrophota bacterium]
MKILSIGDTHGNNVLDRIVPGDFDKIIFLGDYVDSFTVSDEDIINNLYSLIEFKKTYPDKVELLLGNHDLQYLFNDDTKFRCSGRRESYAFLLHNIFQHNLNSFKVAYQMQNYLWTHAGISNGFWDEYTSDSILYNGITDELNIGCKFKLDFLRINFLLADTINDLFFNSQRDVELLSTVGYRRGGHNKFGGIFWADKNELHCRAIVDKQNTALTGYNQ